MTTTDAAAGSAARSAVQASLRDDTAAAARHGDARHGDASRIDDLEVVLAAGRLGYCRLDARGEVLAASSQLKADFGFAPDAPVTRARLFANVDVAARRMIESRLDAALRGGDTFEATVSVPAGDAPSRWIALRGCAARDETGGVASLVLVSRDATSTERANRARDEFLHVFSHELRSPLNAILGWTRILAMKHGDDAGVSQIAARIESGARTQLRMVNDLLDLARMQSGELQIAPRPVRLAGLVAAAVDAVRVAADARRIELRTLLAMPDALVAGDPERLQQVITVLLSNAIKFSADGAAVDVRLTERGDAAELQVVDTGAGIAPELLPRVFDRFLLADGSTTRRHGGLGIGLAIARELVALHGGAIGAASEGPGRGATFTVTLPLHGRGTVLRDDGQAGGAAAATGDRPVLAGVRILVVDDEADARAVLHESLRIAGADVTAVAGADAAFAAFERAAGIYDVIVSDIGMPGEDGLSLMRRLRARRGGDRVVAVAVTGFASLPDERRALAAGFDALLPKPVDLQRLAPQLRRLLG